MKSAWSRLEPRLRTVGPRTAERKHGVIACALLSLSLLLGACTTTLESRPDYIVTSGAGGVALPGEAVIVMDPGLRDEVITAHPESMTGGATTIVLPIGQVIRDVSTKILAPVFTNGATVAPAPKTNAYGVLLRLDSFSYKYDQLSNLGFAITPKATVSMTIEAVGPDGRSLFRKTYVRKDYTTGAYLASVQPAEKINKDVHLALGEIFRDVADDIRAAQPRN